MPTVCRASNGDECVISWDGSGTWKCLKRLLGEGTDANGDSCDTSGERGPISIKNTTIRRYRLLEIHWFTTYVGVKALTILGSRIRVLVSPTDHGSLRPKSSYGIGAALSDTKTISTAQVLGRSVSTVCRDNTCRTIYRMLTGFYDLHQH